MQVLVVHKHSLRLCLPRSDRLPTYCRHMAPLILSASSAGAGGSQTQSATLPADAFACCCAVQKGFVCLALVVTCAAMPCLPVAARIDSWLRECGAHVDVKSGSGCDVSDVLDVSMRANKMTSRMSKPCRLCRFPPHINWLKRGSAQLLKWDPNHGYYGAKGGVAFTPTGGALSAVRVQCARSATIWASGGTRDPYFEILGAPRGIMVTPSGGFDFRFCPPLFGCAKGD